MAKRKIEELPYTNSINQVINPGDSVVFVTVGYSHNVNVSTGVYKGYIVSQTYRGTEYQKVCISVNKKKFIWDSELKKGHYEDYVGRTCLQLNRVYKIDTNLSQIVVN